MQTQRISLSVVLAIFILISCNQQKEQKHLALNEPRPGKLDTLSLSATDAISVNDYNNDFTNSITENFIIQPKKISIITGKKGLKITVNPSKLVKEDGSAPDGKITVSVVELTSSEDLFRSNAATVSNGRLLASGGSYFIGMECNGQKLSLKQQQSMQVSFPILKNEDMELFYGQRNEGNNMNWTRAALLLEPQRESISFTDSNPYEINNFIADEGLSEMQPGKVYPSLDAPVYYYNKKMTLQQLVDTVNHKTAKVYLQTISHWPKKSSVQGYVDSNYLRTIYGPRFQYILRGCSYMYAEEKAKQKREILLQQRKAYRDSVMRNYQPRSLAGQLQKYYAPSDITSLGWINCDRFYQYKEQTDVELDLPITMNNSSIRYFIIYRSFNGLTSSEVNISEETGFVLNKMPVGQSVSFIAFAKYKGMIYQFKKDFTIEKNKKITPVFDIVSEKQLKAIFGKNVNI